MATVDLNEEIVLKRAHDIVGTYNRFDIFDLRVDKRRHPAITTIEQDDAADRPRSRRPARRLAPFRPDHEGGHPRCPLRPTSALDDPRLDQNNDPEYRAKGRKALRAAIGGFFVDMYDVYLPVIALAPAIAYFIPRPRLQDRGRDPDRADLRGVPGRPPHRIHHLRCPGRPRRPTQDHRVGGCRVHRLHRASSPCCPATPPSAGGPPACWCSCAWSTASSSAASTPPPTRSPWSTHRATCAACTARCSTSATPQHSAS